AFQGILAAASPQPASPLLSGHDIDESEPRWNPPSPPTPRRVQDLVGALTPLLRFCREARFVDQYFDASDPAFGETLSAFLRAAQQRRDPASVRLEVHTGCRPTQGAKITRPEVVTSTAT